MPMVQGLQLMMKGIGISMLKKALILIGLCTMSGIFISCGVAKKTIEDKNVNGVIEGEGLYTMDNDNTPTKDTFSTEDISKANVIEVTEVRAGINIKEMAAGTVVEDFLLEDISLSELFYAIPIDDNIKSRINGKSYGENCDVPYEDLRYIRVLHKNFKGNTQIGEMIVNQSIVDDVLGIFEELYEGDYPIEGMVLVDDYEADDDISMEANNSSAFNFRFIDGTTKRSSHSDGLAIDINPLYNPYVRTIDGKIVVLPESGKSYADRELDNPYYIRKDDLCYKAFTGRGFTWGGEWKSSKDYQHFQKSD